MNAAIITYVYRSGFNHEPVEGWLVDLAVLSRNGVLNVSKVEFCPFQNYGRWSWLDAERKEEDAE